MEISIHALRVEGDRPTPASIGRARNFYPRPPGGGRLLDKQNFSSLHEIFLSTPSGWRATSAEGKKAINKVISIHALRVEGDAKYSHCGFDADKFLSTPSGWRATTNELQ